MSKLTNQFKLENLAASSPNTAKPASRPTIPYKQFEFPGSRPKQDREVSVEDFELGGTDSEEEYTEESTDGDRESEDDMYVAAEHRRRRSSQRAPGASGRTRQPHTAGALREDASWSQDDAPWSQDEMSKSEESGDDDEEAGLTGRRERKRRRERNTRLDGRVVPDEGITKEERKEADMSVLKNMLLNGLLIALWYLFSLSISIYNKWMFSSEHLGFHFPLFTTCMHMVVQFSLASLVLYLFPRFRPRADSLSHPGSHYTEEERLRRDEDTSEKKPLMTRWFYFTRLGPCGVATGLDIGLGNMSLQFISLTFYTMCKSSALAFVLLFAFLFRLESPSLRLCLIIALMTIGVIMMVAGEVDFSPLGFVLVISAAFFSGFRWALTQILLLRNPATSNPFASIFYLAPVMFGTLLLIALPVEGPSQLLEGLRELVAKKGPFLGPGIMLAPGVLAFCMTAAEFALLQRTSVVTLSIAGIFKEVVTIFTAGQVFDDTMTTINFIGLAITISAIAGYNYMKVRKMREEAQVQAHLAHLGIAGEEGRGHMHRHEHTAAEEHTDDEERRKGKGVEQQGLLGPRGGSRSVSPRASSPR